MTRLGLNVEHAPMGRFLPCIFSRCCRGAWACPALPLSSPWCTRPQPVPGELAPHGAAFQALVFAATWQWFVDIGHEEAEEQVFHFPPDLPDAQAVGQAANTCKDSRASDRGQGCLRWRSNARWSCARPGAVKTTRRSREKASSILRMRLTARHSAGPSARHPERRGRCAAPGKLPACTTSVVFRPRRRG